MVTNVVAVGRPDGVEGRGAEGVVEAEGVGEEDVVAVGLGVVLGKVRRVAVVGEEDGLAVRTLVLTFRLFRSNIIIKITKILLLETIN